jgi:DNA replication and repair protein RecF
MISNNDFGQVFITDTSMNRVSDIFNKISVPVKLFKVTGGVIDA